MAVGSSKGKRRLMGEINVVPYIDVMLVLLIIFMITAPLLTQGIKVDLPKAEARTAAGATESAAAGPIHRCARKALPEHLGFHPRQPIDDQTALVVPAQALRRAPDRAVLVNGDPAVDYGRVVQARW